MNTPNFIRQTTHDPDSRDVTPEQIAFRLAHGHPITGEKLVRKGAGKGGWFWAARTYQPNNEEYYLSPGNAKRTPHERSMGPPAPVSARSPIIRRKSS